MDENQVASLPKQRTTRNRMMSPELCDSLIKMILSNDPENGNLAFETIKAHSFKKNRNYICAIYLVCRGSSSDVKYKLHEYCIKKIKTQHESITWATIIEFINDCSIKDKTQLNYIITLFENSLSNILAAVYDQFQKHFTLKLEIKQ